ncbi:MAG: ATP-binding protein [Xenococcaceae cyanobacterium]
MDLDSELLLDNLYNAFDPFQPLPAGDPNYVDCRAVRGDEDILEDLGNRIRRSKRMTCHLYSGHRGAGKSTELLRLKQYLEQRKFYVVYFAADAEDIQSEDAQYTDILLACTRHLLQELNKSANPGALLNWIKNRVQELKDLGQTELSLEGLSVEAQIIQVAKLTANLRAEPTMRQQIREKVNPHTVSLIEILNQFLKEAKQKLPNGCIQLAVIVDNLDRITPIIQESRHTNHEEIFIDRSQQLQALDCHVIYTVPISLLYSDRATDIKDIYSDTQVLPMVMMRTPDGEVYQPGLQKIKEVISRRVSKFAPNLSLDTEIFDSSDTLEQLCLMSGGHVRNLLLLMQDGIGRTKELPISRRAVRIAISRARDIYRRTVNRDQWRLLAEVSRSKRIINDDEYRSLLFNRCLLEYRYWDDEGEMQRWCDIHPLIKGIQEFKEAVASLES